MLSRAAERIYWTGRYLERAQNTARIVQQYSQLLLDLPEEVGVEWMELVAIFGARDAYRMTGRGPSETEILNFLLADANSAVSLACSIQMARDNIRNSRDLLPHESWESVNELHQYARQRLALTAAGENRFEVLSECIARCQGINGILADTMSHHSPFHFLTLGASIERADMTSRVIDVAAAYLQENERLVLRYGSTLWTNVLKSVSGFQMYRQYCQPEVEGRAVIDFLLNDQAFPRAMQSCITTAKRTAAMLPRSVALIGALDDAEESLPGTLPEDLDGAAVTDLMDVLQKKLGAAHLVVVDTWFLPEDG
ncbi:MAG: alpha-E domain-containing protein [Gammaproteobacteria bacterium]|nr:alpha-E domain-containing protein [Gammaproteobacteria bacterium]